MPSLLLVRKDLEQSNLLGSESAEGESWGGDGGHGSSGRGEDETSCSGEGGRTDRVQEDDRLRHGHAQQADGEGDSE